MATRSKPAGLFTQRGQFVTLDYSTVLHVRARLVKKQHDKTFFLVERTEGTIRNAIATSRVIRLAPVLLQKALAL